MRQDRLHAGRFADDAKRRAQGGFLHVLDQAHGAVAAHLLVIGDEQVQRPLQLHRLEVGHGGEAGGDEALHVAGAAGEQPSVLAAQGERIGGPRLAVDGNRIDMAGQGQSATGLGAEDRVDIGLVAGRIAADPVADAVSVEIVSHKINQREVGVPARRVEGDEAVQEIDSA